MHTDKYGYKFDLDRNEIDKDNFIDNIDWSKLVTKYEQKYKSIKVAENKGNYQHHLLGIPRVPPKLELRDYQRQAVASWFRNRGRGTLKMATGSGKTIIALAIATELYQQIGLQVLLVVCPYRHLVTQWQRECEKFNLQPILAFENVHNWQAELSTQLYNIRANNQFFLTIITTNSTLINQGVQSELKFFPAKTLIIGDEVHNLGSTKVEVSLPRNIGLRIALSATPERYYDDEGTEAIFAYFGKILQPEFGLAEAIKKGALVGYFYYPLLVKLTASEALIYAKLTKRIGWALSKNENLDNNDTLTSLLVKRSRLIGAAANKLVVLKELMRTRLDTSHTLFYCGDGYIENYAADYNRQLEAVTRILGKELGYRVNTYTADTDLPTRERLRQQFERGELQGLVAIRCLDEGVNIPAIRTAVILASSSNPRQFVH
ncbi:MAG: DEAD/DEAH box helicase family protein [Xenococcaceae cyanobacterium MO_188.B32]|nr:DEAD/DEAH box helicase family protein [Xenococcaceae cyanobacterium MO_188.B32]